MKRCAICGQDFDPTAVVTSPAIEAGQIMAREHWHDEGEVCPTCLASRGILGMMYCQEVFS